MLRGRTEEAEGIAFATPYARNKCHIDPFVTTLHAKIEATLTQGVDEDGDPKPTGVIHLGTDHPDPVMLVTVGLKGGLLHHLCGYLCVRVHLECIGAGPEIDFPAQTKEFSGDDCCDVGPDDWCYYEFEVPIPRDPFTDYGEDCGEACCFAVTATSKDLCERPGHIACWCNGPCVLIHTAPEA